MKLRTGVVVSLLTMAMLATVLQPIARAFIPEPYELYGVARDSAGVVLPNGEPIRSFVDGVDYSNKTSVFSRPSQNDGYFDIDTYGNYMTNLLDPGTPEVKEGANLTEPIMYVWGEMSNDTGNKGVVFKETAAWQTGLPPVAGDLNAAASAVLPPLIKISSIVTQSQLGTMTDFVWLCNPTASPVNASQFYIEKDVLGYFYGPTVQITGTIPAYDTLFVDLLSTTYFVETGDNVKLVWDNTPGPGAAFGGSDIIVDRVEFNATSLGTLFWEPGNTIQGDEVAPLPGGSINRNAVCGDTNSRIQDFSPDIEIRPNNPPLAPYPICLEGSCAPDNRLSHVTTPSNFQITWTHFDPDGDAQTQAQPTIWDGPTQVWTTTVPGTTNSYLVPFTLTECKDYTLRVKTKDAASYGPDAVLPFHTNCKPFGLNNRAPTGTIPAIPNRIVWWSFATDLDPVDTINYTWQVSTNIGFNPPLVSEGTTANNFSESFLTDCGTPYYWHVNASDGWYDSPFTSVAVFNTEACTTVLPPTASAPTVNGYGAGNANLPHLVNNVPQFGWTFTPGVVGRTQTAFNITVENTTTGLVIWNPNTTGSTPSVGYGGGWPLLDGGDYRFRVKVADNSVPALWSGWTAYLDFNMNTPPPAPTLSTPAMDANVAAGATQTVTWIAPTDAEPSDTLTYTYCVATTDPPYPSCGTATAAASTGLTSSAFTTIAGTQYFWAVKANDSYQESAWSTIWTFNATGGAANTAPTITLTDPPATLTKNTVYAVVWTMSDTETAIGSLFVMVFYNSTSASGVIVGPVLGSAVCTTTCSYNWNVPNTELTGVRFTAIVIDAGALMGTDQSTQFNIVGPSQPVDNTVLYIGIIIIIVVVVLVLLLLMKRKKPKEEEEAPAEETAEEAPAEEEVAEEELVEEEVKPAPKAAPAAAAKPGAKPGGKTKECPSCGTIVSATDKECFMCGAKL